jgi:hypothetical protein
VPGNLRIGTHGLALENHASIMDAAFEQRQSAGCVDPGLVPALAPRLPPRLVCSVVRGGSWAKRS